MSKLVCRYCKSKVLKNVAALNTKLLGRKIDKYMCLSCLAEFLDCTEDDLLVKIEEFKEQGCVLFD